MGTGGLREVSWPKELSLGGEGMAKGRRWTIRRSLRSGCDTRSARRRRGTYEYSFIREGSKESTRKARDIERAGGEKFKQTTQRGSRWPKKSSEEKGGLERLRMRNGTKRVFEKGTKFLARSWNH